MTQPLYFGKEPNFQKIILASALIHLIFLTLVVIPIKKREREYKSYYVDLVGPVETRKASVASARKGVEKAKTKAVKQKATPRRRVKPKKGVSLKPVDKDAIVAKEIERLRAISSLSKKKEQEAQESASDREADEEISGAIESIREKVHGRVSVGPSSGRAGSVDSESYHALVIRKIQEEWIHPEYDSDLEAIISIKMDKDGNVLNHKIEQSSGNSRFDQTAVKAIIKASPLPPHPVEREIEMRFRYDKDAWI